MSELIAPVISQVKMPERLSYSDFKHNSDCLLKSWPKSSIVFSRPLPTPVAPKHLIVGRFFHDLLEYVGELSRMSDLSAHEALEEKFFQLIDSYTVKYADDLSMLGEDMNYWSELSDCLEAARHAFRSEVAESGTIYREKEFTRSDLKIYGIIDELTLRDDESIVTDYKARYSIDEDRDSHFYDQLLFYSLLIAKIHTQPVSGRIIGFGGLIKNYPFANDDLISLERAIDGLFLKFEEYSDSSIEALTTPGLTCGECRWRFNCPSVRDSIVPSQSESRELAVFEVVQSDPAGMSIMVVGGSVSPGIYSLTRFNGGGLPVIQGRKYIADAVEARNGVMRLSSNSILGLLEH